MPNYTDHLKLVKPTQDEFYNVDAFNANSDAIDENAKAAEAALERVRKAAEEAQLALEKLSAANIAYSNPELPEIKTVQQALDSQKEKLENVSNSGDASNTLLSSGKSVEDAIGQINKDIVQLIIVSNTEPVNQPLDSIWLDTSSGFSDIGESGVMIANMVVSDTEPQDKTTIWGDTRI